MLMSGALYMLTLSRQWNWIDGQVRYALTEQIVNRFSIVLDPNTPGYSISSSKGIFQPALQVPLYVLGRALDGLAGGNENTYRLWAVNSFNQGCTALGCGILFLCLLGYGFGRKISAITTLIYGFATTAWPYARWLGGERSRPESWWKLG